MPESGPANAWPDWPGVIRPAGWFLSASGEAAPPVRSGTEPARTDAAQAADPPVAAVASQPPVTRQPAAAAAGQPAIQVGVGSKPDIAAQAGAGAQPDTGARPVAGNHDQAGHAATTGSAEGQQDEPGADAEEAAGADPDDGWYDDPQPTGLHQTLRPWSRRQEPQAGEWQEEPGDEPGRPGQAPPYGMAQRVPVVGATAALHGRAGGPGFPVPPGAVSGLYDPAQRSGWQRAQGLWEQSGIAWEPPAHEPRPEHAWGERDGSSGASSPPGGYGQTVLAPPDIPAPSGDEWQAGTRWADSGRSAVWQGGDWQPDAGQAGEWQGADGQPDEWQGATGQAGEWQGADGHQDEWQGAPEPALAPAPTYAGVDTPTRPDWPVPARPGGPPLPAPWEDGEPAASRDPAESDELYRAWQGSVRRASAAGRPSPRVTPVRRRKAWQILRVGVPAAILVTVGAGAVMMLTGKTGEMLDSRASLRTPAPGTGPAFAGYPGQHGTVTVNSIAAAGGVQFGVGSADGHPAIWRRAADGAWTLISAPAAYQRPGTETLTSVAHGPAGWIAVGGVVSGAAQQPIVVTSSDGVTWHTAAGAAAFTAAGTFVMGVTASQNGYVVVGRHVSGGRTFAAMWWSADLRSWVGGNNGGLDGRLASSSVYAVGATASGFVAAGTHGGCHTIWTSANGRNWSDYDVPKPPGATDALLSQVAVNGTRVVTAGYVVGKTGDMPVVVASTDGGAHWRQILLPAPAGLGSVTALTAAGNGFVAAGQAGPLGARHAVTWTSPDGLTWSAATPVSLGQITALSASGSTVLGTAQRGAGPAVLTFAAP